MAVRIDPSRKKTIVTLAQNPGLAIGPGQSLKKMDVALDQFHVIGPSPGRLRKRVPEVRAGRGPKATKLLRRQITTKPLDLKIFLIQLTNELFSSLVF